MIPYLNALKQHASYLRALFLGLSVIFIRAATVAVSVHAQHRNQNQYDPCEVFGNCLDGTTNLKNAESAGLATNLILSISWTLIYIGVAVAVLFMVLGGWKLITANGDDATYKSGISMVVNAVIGLVLIIISMTIVTLVSAFVSGFRLNIF